MSQKLSIVIPAYNEEKTIRQVLDKVIKVDLINGLQKEILVINDCSTDTTQQIIDHYIQNEKNTAILLFNQSKNLGKGAAIRKGIELATGDFIIIQDADLEYNPDEYNTMLTPFTEGYADVVYGSRFQGGKPHRILFFTHTMGNKIITFLSNLLTNLNLTDIETGFKMFRTEIIRKIKLKENRFGIEPEITAKISRIPNIRIYEVGISYYGRTYDEGKKINWKDGFRAIYCILKYNLICRKIT